MVSPHADDLLKIAFVKALRQVGMTQEEFRRLSDVKECQVAALFDPDAPSEIADMEHALAILGHRLRIAVDAA